MPEPEYPTIDEVREAYALDELAEVGESADSARRRGGYKFDLWLGFLLREACADVLESAADDLWSSGKTDGQLDTVGWLRERAENMRKRGSLETGNE